jgi:sugar phosphate isomerase/epimerase
VTAVPPLGIFARVFPVAPAAEVAQAIAGAGYDCAQLNLRAIGLPTIPAADAWEAIDPEAIATAFAEAGVSVWGVSGTYNLAHPDPSVRAAGTKGVVELVKHAARFGAGAVTLCTGSRNPTSMWAHHPDNTTEDAWHDMRAELDVLVAAALDAGVILGIEPEPGNVVRDAAAAARLLHELGPDASAIGIVADSANLLTGLPLDRHRRVLERSFTMLRDRIACLHAKDLVPWSQTLDGHGVVDYAHVASLHVRLELTAPVIVQDVAPEQAAAAREYIDRGFRRAGLGG